MKKSRIVLIVLLAFIVLIPAIYVAPQDRLRTIREILNDVYDRTNAQLMGTPWAGAQGQVSQSETQIFNNVYDPVTHSLRLSGNGGGGLGTLTQVGDCSAQTCLDGTATGGTQFSLYDGNSNKTTFSLNDLTANRTVTWPDKSGTPPLIDSNNRLDVGSNIFSPPRGTSLPATCTIGDVFFLSNATVGRNWYGCTGTNTWTLLGDGVSGLVVGGLTDAATVGVNLDNCQYCYLTSLSQNSTIANPTGTTSDRLALIIEIVSSTSRTLGFGTKYVANTGIPLPTATTGGGKKDVFGFRYIQSADQFELISSTQTPKGAITKTINISFGADNGTALTNADICPQLDQAFVAYAGTVTEINIKADAGTPNLIVHRRNNAGTITDLLSSALATGASGAFACSKTSAVVGYTSGVTCSATLQNTSLTAGDWIGFTNGGCSASTAKKVSVSVVYELQ